MKSGEWKTYENTFRTEVKATEWAFGRIKEAFDKVAKNEAKRPSTVQEIMIRSTDYLRCIIAPTGEQGGVTMSHLCPQCNSFPIRLRMMGCGVRSVKKNTTGSNQTSSCWCKTGESVNPAKVFMWELVQCFEVAGEPKRGWTRPHVSRQGLPEGLRKFIQVDNHRAPEVGHLSEGLESFKVRSRKVKKGTQR